MMKPALRQIKIAVIMHIINPQPRDGDIMLELLADLEKKMTVNSN